MRDRLQGSRRAGGRGDKIYALIETGKGGWSVSACMPTVLRRNGYRFYFFSHEPNEPPHIHADKGDATIKVWLDTLEVAKNRGFSAHEIAGIIAIIGEHRALFVEKWHEHFG